MDTTPPMNQMGNREESSSLEELMDTSDEAELLVIEQNAIFSDNQQSAAGPSGAQQPGLVTTGQEKQTEDKIKEAEHSKVHMYEVKGRNSFNETELFKGELM